jgi:2-polyprenyl-3-methyl-5-hydroxy-6-metoxy-1,4-benzoquinol methylase
MDEIAVLYARHARSFDQARSRRLLERPYLNAALSALPASARVLDLGCGAGEPIARYFVEKGHHVTGVDAAAPMIELCRSRMPEMTWVQADMRSLVLAERFELVVAWDSFFHLNHPDQRAMFATFERHAAPGGALLFTSGPSEGVALGDLFGDELYHSSLDAAEYRELLQRHGYEVMEHRTEDPDCGGHTVWLARKQ